MTTCDEIGKRHRWRERTEKYSNWSSQAVGSSWVCLACGKRSEDRPPAAVTTEVVHGPSPEFEHEQAGGQYSLTLVGHYTTTPGWTAGGVTT